MSRRFVAQRRRPGKKPLVIISVILVLVMALVFSAGYFTGSFVTKKSLQQPEGAPEVAPTDTTQPSQTPTAQNAADTTAATVDELMKDMSLSDMVYQMMFVTPESITKIGTAVAAGETTRQAIEKYPVGGIVYFAKNFESRDQTIQMISNTQSYSEIPVFISVDEEGGRVSRLGSNGAMGTTKHPPMKQIGDGGDAKKAYEVGKTLATELKALGFNVDFAPDADVLVNAGNTEIGDRSFGSDPALVASMVESTVKGMQENGLSATLKHFPGHGSTQVDSHTGYSASTRTLEQLRQSEFLPFKNGIDAGADFIMVSHMTLVNAVTEKVPASISKEVITDMLIDELGYQGIIITDSFSMGAITQNYSAKDAAVRAIKAGVDMILMPADLEATHAAIVSAVESGDISRGRIEQSVRKILALKLKKQMIQN
ncbi:MAG: glycoside hydrolase family 3 protein [Ruminococcaceae bacterium]|nr:glycoside hydrolase family 3 protein [Oscillospiraceae bacterium]